MKTFDTRKTSETIQNVQVLANVRAVYTNASLNGTWNTELITKIDNLVHKLLDTLK